MSNYKRNADSNRDALFGPASGAGSGAGGSRTKNVSSSGGVSSSYTPQTVPSATTNARIGQRRTNTVTTSLRGEAKAEKMKEAEEYRKKAKKALTKTLFSSPDPIAGSMFYHRAAEAYKVCGENRLERLHRIASADCQLGHGAFATAAQEYMRAAELSEVSDETKGRKRAECTKLYRDAAHAWKETGESGRAAECMLKSAFSLLIGKDDDEDEDEIIAGQRIKKIDNDALKGIEAAVESHVPDPLNRYKEFRQTGVSDFVNPDTTGEEDEEDEEALMEICRNHMITKSYAHETVFLAVQKLVEFGEYKSALYAAGAVTTLLEYDGFATISLSRAFCVETILALAMGDVVTADKFFLQVHLQKNHYLSSRECKLSEDLIRAVKMRDVDALDIARDPNGENRSGLANLDAGIRRLVLGLRISGAAKKKTVSASPAALTTSALNVNNVASNPPRTTGNLDNELDDLMNDMGLGDDDDEDDDDIDLT